jgi:hypothetical protein
VKNADGPVHVLERSAKARQRIEALAESSTLRVDSFL